MVNQEKEELKDLEISRDPNLYQEVRVGEVEGEKFLTLSKTPRVTQSTV